MSPKIDTRLEQLQKFVEQYCLLKFDSAVVKLHARSGDASSRRYFNVEPHSQLLAVDSPAENKTVEFIRIASYLSQRQVYAPKVLFANPRDGFMAVENIQPSKLFYEALNSDRSSVLDYLNQATAMLCQMQQNRIKPDWLATYHEVAIRAELSLFSDWFLDRQLGVTINRHLTTQLDYLFECLVDNFLQQPQVFVHRDFHCRNLLLDANNQLAIIDFQDALWGPITYDLASLVRDCYIKYPIEVIQRFVTQLKPADIATDVWQRWFNLTSVQRLLKVLGIFSRLSIRDGKPHYLSYIQHIVAMLQPICKQYDELQMLDELITDRIQSKLNQADYYGTETSQYPLLNLIKNEQ